MSGLAKGLEISRGYFYDECLPRLRTELPAVMPYIAAGLVGEGSDCFGYDDFISRDHDWGPAFCLWLPERLMDEYAVPLKEILTSMPDRYRGHRARKLVGEPRVGLRGIEEFYASLIDCPGVPKSNEQWLAAPESGLAAAVNGEVFIDNCGEFSAVREGLLAHYPEDARLRLLAQRCAMAAQTGQYNYARCLSHGEPTAATVLKSRFAENAAGAIFLLNRRYMPFYKWSYRALRGLPKMGERAGALLDIIVRSEGNEAINAIETLSAMIISELGEQGLSDSKSDFLMDHCGGLIRRIEDEVLRTKPVSLMF